jgi:hypothetical protein
MPRLFGCGLTILQEFLSIYGVGTDGKADMCLKLEVLVTNLKWATDLINDFFRH